MSAQPKRLSGFTLPELLTTLAVAAIATSLAVPGIQAAMADQNRASAINELVGTLHLARSTAITRNRAVTVCASADGVRCKNDAWEKGWIAFVDENLDRVPDADGVLATGSAVGVAVRIRSEQFVPYLAYRPNGQIMIDRPDENSGQFTVCDARGADAARIIAIQVAGLPRMVDRQADGRAPVCPEA